MANDRYQYLQGRRFATEMLQSLGNQINDPKILLPMIDRLEAACSGRPASYAEGIQSQTNLARIAMAGEQVAP